MDSLISETKQYLTSNLDNFINLVIKAMIEYYGEEYSDEIVSRVKNTNFIFYVNPKYKLNNKKVKANYKYIKQYHSRLCKEVKNTHNYQIYNQKGIPSVAASFSISMNSISFVQMFNNELHSIEKVVSIPLFFTEDASVIHEMIHAIMSIPVGVIDNHFGYTLKNKFGICSIGDKKSEILEECLTEIEAQRIYQLLGNTDFINKYFPNNKFDCFYNKFIPLVLDFYNKYKEELINARITLNNRGFIDMIGREKYEEFTHFLNDYYNNYDNSEYSFYKHVIDKCVTEMGKSKQLLLK